MKQRQKKQINDVFDKLADLFEYGHLMAATDPVQFIQMVVDHIKELREKTAAPARL